MPKSSMWPLKPVRLTPRCIVIADMNRGSSARRMGYVLVASERIPNLYLVDLESGDITGLEGVEANSILVLLISQRPPGLMAGFMASGVSAAIMSTLDSQGLAIGSVFTHDIVRYYWFHNRLSEKHQLLVGR